MRCIPAAAIVVLLASSCSDGDRRAPGAETVRNPRRSVVWLSENGLDELTAAELARVGIDEVVIRRGVVDLAGEAPVLRFAPKAAIAGDLPVGLVLEVEGAREGLDVVVVVCANRSYRILQIELARAGIAEPGPAARSLADLGHPELDWTALARGLGVPATRVSDADAFAKELARALADPGPTLIEALL